MLFLSRGPHAPKLNAFLSQSLIGIVGPKRQSIFRPRGEHSIGLSDPLGHEVIDQNPEVALRPIKDDLPAPTRQSRSVQASHEALSGGLFISSHAVDLP